MNIQDNILLSALASAAYNTVMFLRNVGQVCLLLMGFRFMYEWAGGNAFVLAVGYTTVIYFIFEAFRCHDVLVDALDNDDKSDDE